MQQQTIQGKKETEEEQAGESLQEILRVIMTQDRLVAVGRTWQQGISQGSVWLSEDKGGSWHSVDTLSAQNPNKSTESQLKDIIGLENGRLIAIGSEQKNSDRNAVIWISDDQGDTWQRAGNKKNIFNIAGKQEITTIVKTNKQIVAGGKNKKFGAVWVSDDSGTNWLKVPDKDNVLDEPLQDLAWTGERLVAISKHHIWVSDDEGYTWQRVPGKATIFPETPESNVSTEETPQAPDTAPDTAPGKTQEAATDKDLEENSLSALTSTKNRLVAVGRENGSAAAWISEDQGETWIPTIFLQGSIDSSDHTYIEDVVAVGSEREWFVAVGWDASTTDRNGIIWISEDQGETWLREEKPATIFGGRYEQKINGITAVRAQLIAVGHDNWKAAVWTGKI